MKESAIMTTAICPEHIDGICLCGRADKKEERKKRSRSEKTKNPGKPPPEKHGLKDDPEFLKLVILSKVNRVY